MPPDSAGFDWWHAVTGAGGGIVGTFLTWFWRAARVEPRLTAEIKAAEYRADEKVEEMTGHFQEAFAGIRRQIDEHKLHTETNFVRKDDFREFCKEYREDMRDLKQMIASMKQ